MARKPKTNPKNPAAVNPTEETKPSPINPTQAIQPTAPNPNEANTPSDAAPKKKKNKGRSKKGAGKELPINPESPIASEQEEKKENVSEKKPPEPPVASEEEKENVSEKKPEKFYGEGGKGGKGEKSIIDGAYVAWFTAQELLKKNDYNGARACMEEPLRLLLGGSDSGFERVVVFETLYYGVASFPSCGIDWYSILHLHPSVSDLEVKSQSEELLNHIISLGKSTHNLRIATGLIEQAVSVLSCVESRVEFDTKRKESGLVDFPIASTELGTFREKYLKWKPPILAGSVDALGLGKEARNDDELLISPVEENNPSLVDPSVSKVAKKRRKHQVFDEIPQKTQDTPLESNTGVVGEGMKLSTDDTSILPVNKEESVDALGSGKSAMNVDDTLISPADEKNPSVISPPVVKVPKKRKKHQVLDEMPQKPQDTTLENNTTDVPEGMMFNTEDTLISPVDEKEPASVPKKRKKHQVLDEMPQNPQDAPLENYTSNVGEGMVTSTDDTQIPPVAEEEPPSVSNVPKKQKSRQQGFDEMPQKLQDAPLENITNADGTQIATVDEKEGMSVANVPKKEKKKQQVFDEMPQNPHDAPLENDTRDVPEGILSSTDDKQISPVNEKEPQSVPNIVKKLKRHQISDEVSQNLPDAPLENNGGNSSEGMKLSIEDTPISPVDEKELPSVTNVVKKLKRHQVFEEIPQNPHYAPLDKYTSDIREGVILRLDVDFIFLCEEIQKLDNPQSLWSRLPCFTEHLTELEKMGYNVEKLKKRVETLKGIAEHARELVSKDEAEVQDHLNVVKKSQAKVQVHEEKIQKHADKIAELKAEIRRRKREIKSLKKRPVKALDEFTLVAKSSWK